ncbi:MAG: FAD:protein FMN transferase [Coriobacteriales bacterium]|jgi:thiamine biosynthesis lipoprotein|nr:FAD:protein FMN transferase [Coriobacteriales bacterium]
MLHRRDFITLLFGGATLVYGGALLGACSTPASDPGVSDEDTGLSGVGTDALGEPVSLSEFLFDTFIEIKAYCSHELLDRVYERLVFFEDAFSRTREGSDIYRINAAAGLPVDVSSETADVITRAQEFSELSGGLFDITIGSVTRLWDFSEGVIPAPDELAEALAHIDYRNITVEGNTVTLADPQAQLDLGGIAKGYIADDIVALLKEGGCLSANINLGGNVYAMGSKPDGSAWNIGIQDPFNSRGNIIGSVPVIDQSVSTSGPYERGFEANGVLYHHILDPRTGYPVQTDLVSTTIVSTSSTTGDALSTTAFLMGATAALELIDAETSLQGILVDESGQVLCSREANINLL